MGPCFYCGRETFRRGANDKRPDTYTRDHLIPRRLRRVSLQNIAAHLKSRLTVTCCNECNIKKGAKTPFAFASKVHLSQEKKQIISGVFGLNQ